MWVKYELIRRSISPKNENFQFSEIFFIVIHIVIKNAVQLKIQAINICLGILVHMIAIHHHAKEQLAWLDVMQIKAPYLGKGSKKRGK